MEWIVTNGIGGYASSTICGLNSRRYHGLLVASLSPPTERKVILSNIEEKVKTVQGSFEISTNQYPGTIHPQGFIFLKSFNRTPLPESVFEGEYFSLKKTVFMPYGHNSTVIEYQNTGHTSFFLELTPLFVYRDYHHLFHKTDEFPFVAVGQGDEKIVICHLGDPTKISIHFSEGVFEQKEDWYNDFEYEWEKKRGLDFKEDACSVGTVRVQQ